MDGVMRQVEGLGAARDLVRDQNSRWIIRFSIYLGNCIVMEVELWGILDGKLPLESKTHPPQKNSSNPDKGKAVKDSKYPLGGNTIANSLVKMIRNRKQSLRWFENPTLR
ncbi:hypothetical protein Godav_015835, partial [Gossypium davidsonii]|nr:hypothetical protein [Gossypium davidsonii]